jgi:peptide/nickel transport system substrate-binding protein
MIGIGTAIAGMWTKIGVKVTIKDYEWGAFRRGKWATSPT